MGEVGLVAVAGLAAFHLAGEEFAYLLFFHCYGGQYDVHGFAVQHLQYALAKVALEHLDAMRLKVGVEPALLGQHRLALDQVLDVVVAEYLLYYLAVLGGVLGPVYDGAVACGVGLELGEQGVEVGVAVLLELVCGLAQLLPFGHLVGHAVTFFAHKPQGFVVPGGLLLVAQKLFGLLCVFRHFLKVFVLCAAS